MKTIIFTKEEILKKIEEAIKEAEKEGKNEDAWGKVGAYARMVGKLEALVLNARTQIVEN